MPPFRTPGTLGAEHGGYISAGVPRSITLPSDPSFVFDLLEFKFPGDPPRYFPLPEFPWRVAVELGQVEVRTVNRPWHTLQFRRHRDGKWDISEFLRIRFEHFFNCQVEFQGQLGGLDFRSPIATAVQNRSLSQLGATLRVNFPVQFGDNAQLVGSPFVALDGKTLRSGIDLPVAFGFRFRFQIDTDDLTTLLLVDPDNHPVAGDARARLCTLTFFIRPTREGWATILRVLSRAGQRAAATGRNVVQGVRAGVQYTVEAGRALYAAIDGWLGAAEATGVLEAMGFVLGLAAIELGVMLAGLFMISHAYEEADRQADANAYTNYFLRHLRGEHDRVFPAMSVNARGQRAARADLDAYLAAYSREEALQRVRDNYGATYEEQDSAMVRQILSGMRPISIFRRF